jgi:hypothetical protein
MFLNFPFKGSALPGRRRRRMPDGNNAAELNLFLWILLYLI